MDATETAPGLRSPRQERSRQTLERLLDAAETLLEDSPFEEVGVQQLVGRARTSVGAFYSRFEDKDSLLSALYARYDASLPGHAAAWRAKAGAPPRHLAGAAQWVARYLVHAFRSRRHLLRALALHVRRHPELVDNDARRRRAEQHRFLVDALLACRAEIEGEPEEAVASALFLAVSACRERILFPEGAHARAVPRADGPFARELTRLLRGYLSQPPL